MKVVSKFTSGRFRLPFVGRVALSVAGTHGDGSKAGLKIGSHEAMGVQFDVHMAPSPGMCKVDSPYRVPAWCVRILRPAQEDKPGAKPKRGKNGKPKVKKAKKQVVPNMVVRSSDMPIVLPNNASITLKAFWLERNPDAVIDVAHTPPGEDEDGDECFAELNRLLMDQEIKAVDPEKDEAKQAKAAEKKRRDLLLEASPNECEDLVLNIALPGNFDYTHTQVYICF